MIVDKSIGVIDFLFNENFLGLSIGDGEEKIEETMGSPEDFSDRNLIPITYKYGNIFFTCIDGKISGIGIDLSQDASPPPENTGIASMLRFSGASRQELTDFFSRQGFELRELDEHSLAPPGGRGFLSFQDDSLYRIGLRQVP